MNEYLNPYGIQNPMLVPKHKIRQCDGESGAKNMVMGPDSQEIFIDSTAPLIWMVVTDENANKVSVNGFRIEPYIPEPEPDLKMLLARIDKLEEMIANGHSKPNAGDAPTKFGKRPDSKWNNESNRAGVQNDQSGN